MTVDKPNLSPVSRKVHRLRLARKSGDTVWRHLAHMGVLGWLMILPILLGLWVGRVIARSTGSPVPLLLGLFSGLGVGAYVVFRQVRSSLEEKDDEGST